LARIEPDLTNINMFFFNASCRSLHSTDDSSNYMTVAREYVQNLEYKVEGARLDLYKNKEVCNNVIGKLQYYDKIS